MRIHPSYLKCLVIFIWSTLIMTSCDDDDDCNDCLEIRTQEVRYVDNEGVNLLFGENAIFNPDGLIIQDITNENTEYTLNSERGTILLTLEPENDHFEIQPADSIVNTLELNLVEIESKVCCGSTFAPSSILLDNQNVPNANIIDIIIE